MLDPTVSHPAAEREPDHVTPIADMTAAEAAQLRALFAGNPVIDHAEQQLRAFGVVDGELADVVRLLLAWPDFNLLTEREVRGVAARFVPVPAEPDHVTPDVHLDGPATWESENLPCGTPFTVIRYGETTSDPAKVTCAGCRATFPKPVDAAACGACNGSGTTGSLDTEVFECVVCDGTGLSAQARVEPLGSSYSGAVLDAVAETLAGQPAEDDEDDLVPAPGCGHPMPQGVDCCVSTRTAPEPERRTVSLEVLTPELRVAACNADAEDPAGKVGIVMRVNGQVVDIPELDTLWAAPFRQAPDVLAKMLEQGRNYASGIDGQAGAELLMPTPDVLAALDGRPDAQLLTAPVHVLAMDVTPGMLLAPESAAPQRRVTGMPKCTDPDCVFGSCTVFVVDELPGELHQSGYARTRVRIPASVTR